MAAFGPVTVARGAGRGRAAGVPYDEVAGAASAPAPGNIAMRYSVVQPRVATKDSGDAPAAGAATGAPPPTGVPLSVPRRSSERPAPPRSKPRGSAAPRAPSSAPPVPPKSKAAAPARTPSGASPAGVVARALPTVPASPAAGRASGAPAPIALPEPPSRSASEPLADSVEDSDLVVTVAPSDWNLPSRDALVGHGAVRVAIAPGRGSGGTLMVRPLKPGEVAPRGATVAVLVTLEPGAPLPRV